MTAEERAKIEMNDINYQISGLNCNTTDPKVVVILSDISTKIEKLLTLVFSG